MVRFKNQKTIEEKLDPTDTVTIPRQEYETLKQKAEEASYDGLTGLLNRKRFDELLVHDMTVARRQIRSGGSPDNLVLMYFDLNGLKYVNDTYGHESGDDLLQNAANLIYHFLKRESDTVARIGGDEFAAILPQTDLKHANSIAFALQEGAKHLGVSVAVGMASYQLSVSDPTKSDKTDEYKLQLDDIIHELKSKADTAMYENKGSIKQKLNVAHFYDQHYNKNGVDKIKTPEAVYAA